MKIVHNNCALGDKGCVDNCTYCTVSWKTQEQLFRHFKKDRSFLILLAGFVLGIIFSVVWFYST